MSSNLSNARIAGTLDSSRGRRSTDIGMEFTRNACIQVESMRGDSPSPAGRREPRCRADRSSYPAVHRPAALAPLDPRAIAGRALAPRATAIHDFPEFPASAFRYPEKPAAAALPAPTSVAGTDRVAGSGRPKFSPSVAAPSVDRASQQAVTAAEGISFQYVPLIQCSFPHADPKEAATFTRRNGWLELTLGTTRPDTRLAVRRSRATADDLLHLRSGAHQLAGNLLRAFGA